jgi:hypothetical protein
MTERSERDDARAAIRQLLINVGLQVAMSGVHLALILWAVLGTPGASDVGTERGLGMWILLAWGIAGLVWTPLNARGLWKRRDWARRSAIAYWVISMPFCCCFPVGIYAIWSLRRPRVRALFDAELS